MGNDHENLLVKEESVMAAFVILHALVTSFVMPPARHVLNAPSRPSLAAVAPRMIGTPGVYSPRYTHYPLGSEYSPYNNGRYMQYYGSPWYSSYNNGRHMHYPPYYSSYNNGRYSSYNNVWPQYSSYNNGRYMNYPAQDRLTTRMGLVAPYNGGHSMYSPYGNGRYAQNMYHPPYYSPYYNSGRYSRNAVWPQYSPYNNGRFMNYPAPDRLT